MSTPSIQDRLLKALQDEKQPIQLYLVSGIKLNGVILGFDAYVIILQGGENHGAQMVYKHAVSTIVPPKTFKLPILAA